MFALTPIIYYTLTLKSYLDGLSDRNMQQSNETAGEGRMRALMEEGFKNVLQNTKSEDSSKNSMNKQ